MVILADIRQAATLSCDECWAVTISDKRMLKKAVHVPELAPSWNLFRKVQAAKAEGTWDMRAFREWYVPQFVTEIHNDAARAKLKELVEKSNAGRRIVLYCFCTDERICHRMVLGKILKAKTQVVGLEREDGSWGVTYDWGPEKPKTVMAVSGPRAKKLCGYGKEAYEKAVDEMEAEFRKFYADGIRTWLLGGAQGIDQLAFWAMYRLKREHSDVKIRIYVPFPGQESLWARKGLFSQAEYRQMLSLADEIIMVEPEKPATRHDVVCALMARNHRMVADMDVAFVVSNADGGDFGQGGTAAFMNEVHRKGKPMFQYLYGTEPELHISRK